MRSTRKFNRIDTVTMMPPCIVGVPVSRDLTTLTDPLLDPLMTPAIRLYLDLVTRTRKANDYRLVVLLRSDAHRLQIPFAKMDKAYALLIEHGYLILLDSYFVGCQRLDGTYATAETKLNKYYEAAQVVRVLDPQTYVKLLSQGQGQ